MELVTIVSIILALPALLALLLVCYLAVGLLLHVAVWLCWVPRGKTMLLVYSNSPVWQRYFETEVLPFVTSQAVVLNWSERRSWPATRRSLAVMCFRYFAGSRNYNPMAIVFAVGVPATVVRFYLPFRDYKHGNHAPIDAARRRLFELAGLAVPHDHEAG